MTDAEELRAFREARDLSHAEWLEDKRRAIHLEPCGGQDCVISPNGGMSVPGCGCGRETLLRYARILKRRLSEMSSNLTSKTVSPSLPIPVSDPISKIDSSVVSERKRGTPTCYVGFRKNADLVRRIIESPVEDTSEVRRRASWSDDGWVGDLE